MVALTSLNTRVIDDKIRDVGEESPNTARSVRNEKIWSVANGDRGYVEEPQRNGIVLGGRIDQP